MKELADWFREKPTRALELMKYYVPKFIFGYTVGVVSTSKTLGLFKMPLFLLSWIAYCTMAIFLKPNFEILFSNVPREERTWLQLKLNFIMIGCGWAAYVVPRYL